MLLLDEVFAVGDEAFQRKCFGKIFEFKQRGGTIVFVSHDASAVERLCDRAILLRDGRSSSTGRRTTRSSATTACSPSEVDPAERGAGLREWGSGEARIEAVELLGADGEARQQFLAGEGALRLRVVGGSGAPAPRLRYELRDEAGILLAAGLAGLGELGWDGAGDLALRFEVERLPLADGRFHFRLALTDPESGRLLHHLDEAARSSSTRAATSGAGFAGRRRLGGEESGPPPN